MNSADRTYKSVSRLALIDGADIEAEIPDCFCLKHTMLSVAIQTREITMTFTRAGIQFLEVLRDDNNSKDVGVVSVKIKATKIPYKYCCNAPSYSIRFGVAEFAKHLKSVPRERKLSIRVGHKYGFSMWLESQNSLTKIKHSVVEPARVEAPMFQTPGSNVYTQKISMIDKACSGSESLVIMSANWTRTDSNASGVVLASKIENAGSESFMVCGKGLNGRTIKSVTPDAPFSVTLPKIAVSVLKMSSKWGQDKNSPFYVCGYSDETNGDLVKFKFLISYYGTVMVALRDASYHDLGSTG